MRAESLGMILDFTHLSDLALKDALQIVTKPFFYSHTGAFKHAKSYKSLPDKDIRAIAKKRGLIGVSFDAQATGGESIQDIVDNIKYIAKVAGAGNVALGSGWDGLAGMPAGLDAAGMWRITDALLKDGTFDHSEIEAIMGGNALMAMYEALREPLRVGDVNEDMYVAMPAGMDAEDFAE